MADTELFEIVLDEVINDVRNQIGKARAREDEDMEKFDKTNTRNDWIAYVMSYAGDAVDKVIKKRLPAKEADDQRFDTNMIKAAGLALTAVVLHRTGYC